MAYQDFKSYIADKYMDLLHREISDYVEAHHDGIGFHGHSVLTLCEQRVENIEVKSLRCVDQPDPFVKIDVNVTADIVMEGLGTSKYDADRKTKWFTVHLDASLRNGLEIRNSSAEEYNPQKFEITTALDEYLIPYISTDMLEDEAEDFYEFYCWDAIYYEGWRLPVETILQEMEIQYYEAPLPDNVFGRMYFRKTDVDVYEYTPYMIQKMIGKKERQIVHKDIEPGTMLISHDRTFMDGIGSSLNTIAHELVHWEKHQKFFKILSLLNEDDDSLSCEVNPQMSSENLEGVQKAIWWAEWQANALAPRILMPRTMFLELFDQIYEEQSRTPYFQTGDIMERTLDKLGGCFGVSKYAAKTRAIQLGIDTADGAWLFVDGEYYYPLNYPIGTLAKNQTFVVDKASAQEIIDSNPELEYLVDIGAIIYTGCVFCVNDSRYIKKSSDSRHEYELTQYALEHADECCLIFERSFSENESTREAEVYSLFYLSQEVKASLYMEAHYNSKFEHNQTIEELAKEVAQMKKMFAKERRIKKEMPLEFNETLKYHMSRRSVSVINLMKRSHLSDTTIKHYRSGKRTPDMEKLMAILIGLNLDKQYCYDMIEKAGLHLTDSDLHKLYDRLIQEHMDGDIDQWNMVLKAGGFEEIPGD